MNALTSGALFAEAQNHTAQGRAAMAAGYAATVTESGAGKSHSDIVKDWKAHKVTGFTSVALVGDSIRAHSLTRYGVEVYETACEAAIGGYKDAHKFITRARKAVKAKGVDEILADVRDAISSIDPDATTEDREVAMVKALTKAIKALAKAKAPVEDDGDQTGEDSEDVETPDVEDVEDSEDDGDADDPWATATGMLSRAVAQVLHAAGGSLTGAQSSEVREILLPLVAQAQGRKTA